MSDSVLGMELKKNIDKYLGKYYIEFVDRRSGFFVSTEALEYARRNLPFPLSTAERGLLIGDKDATKRL